MKTSFDLLWTLVLSGLSATIVTSAPSPDFKTTKEVYHITETITHLCSGAEIKNTHTEHTICTKEETHNNIGGNEILQYNYTSFGHSSGVQYVKLRNFDAFPVLLNNDKAGPGWIVIQQRINGEENFYRNWEDYKNGFGQFTGDFFLGLEKIHRLTNDRPHELYIYLEGFSGSEIYKTPFFARYDNFRISGENDKYRLVSLGLYSGSADWDRMRYSENKQFTTFDRHNSAHIANCAKENGGGGWFDACGHCNLNGIYHPEERNDPHFNWWASHYSLKTIKMLIRPRDYNN